jgi:CHAT domain-containing protein/Tfp pilus assembly protein PilF
MNRNVRSFVRIVARRRPRQISAAVAATVAACLALQAREVVPVAHAAQPAQRSETTRLIVGAAVERELADGDQHAYELDLQADQYASVTVDSRGIHAIAEAIGPDGGVISEFAKEDRNYGHEHLEMVAQSSGRYRVLVKPALNNLAAGRYAIRLDEIRAATGDDRDMAEARRLLASARRLRDEGNFGDARGEAERALTIGERVRGPEDPNVAAIVVLLGDIAVDLENSRLATSLYERAQKVFEQKLGDQHPMTASVWERLGGTYWRAGRRPDAEKVTERALEVSERALGPNHPLVARSLAMLSLLRHAIGDLEKAEELDRRAMGIVEKSLGTNDELYAELLNDLALALYDRNHDYTEPETLLRRALEIEETLLGPQSYKVSIALQNLAMIARERKNYDQAEEYNRRVLAIRQRIIGPDHPDIAPILNNLALVYRDKGDVAKSLDTHFQALRIWEQSGGPYDNGTMMSLGNIARTYAAIGDTAHAIEFQRRVDAVLETQLELNLSIGSERQRRAFAGSMLQRTDRTISLSLRQAPDEPDANALAALVLLQRKGRVLDAMTDTLAAVRRHAGDPAERGMLDQLGATVAQLARVALNRPEDMAPTDHQRLIKELEEKREKLEAQISDRDAEFRAHSQTVTVAAVQAAIPDRAALVEFAVFRPFDPKASSNSAAYGKPHYAAYVIRRLAPPHGRDLGPAAVIDEAIDALRQALRDPTRNDVKALARAVDGKVLAPIRALVGDATRLVISPDGELSLIPFEALVDDRDRYAIERYAINYVTSGSDLLRMQVPRTARSAPTIVADPLFGEPAPSGAAEPRSNSRFAAASARRTVTTAPDLSTVYFAPLPGTADEARAIKSLFPEARVLNGQKATKSELLQLEAPRILHIATHGFFLDDPGAPAASATSPDATRAINATARVENPLLRSGLALTGANLTKGATDEGILTALEASNLNLWGTKLVTLSACDTGVGEVRNGEGIYGLRRAFFLAGAETLVMSLWPVSDAVTRQMMSAYYAGLKVRHGRGDALRDAQLAMLARTNRRHPFYWASFIQAGEWANLDGVR